jgi:hypothetical protein
MWRLKEGIGVEPEEASKRRDTAKSKYTNKKPTDQKN